MNEVLPLFSVPIYTIDRYKDTNDDFSELALSQDFMLNNHGNLTSTNNYILDLPEFNVLKERIEDAIKEYSKDILCLTTQNFYITQSWINTNKKGVGHHSHHHNNSIFSGVYYIKAVESCIRFHAPNHHLSGGILDIGEPTEFNLWNSQSWNLPVEDNTIVLFPSSTTHSVDENQFDSTRISLSFNVFISGTLGSQINLTELKL